jgi:hypothetical protein
MRKRTITTVSWEKYLIDNNQTPRIKRFLESRGSDIYNQISENVHKAYLDKKESIVVVVHPHISNAIIIKKHEYIKFLTVALNWFKKQEEYKQCARIKSWIDIQSNKKNIKKTDKVKNNIFI